MKEKSLAETAPFLRSPVSYRKFLVSSVIGSTAVEIGRVPASLQKKIRLNSLHPDRISLSK